MRNLKLGLFSMLCAVFMFGITTAFDINVGPESYYGTLTLNTGYFKYGNGNTGILIGYDGASNGPSIKIGKRNATAYSGIELLGGQSKILVNQICDASNGNCKPVSQLSTGNGITINGQNGQNYICTKTNNNTLECSTAKLGTDFNNNNNRTRYCTYTPSSGLNCNTSINIPTVGNGTITIIQSGISSSQTFNLNDSSSTTIYLNDTTYSKATSTALGLIQVGYSEPDNANNRNYAVRLTGNNAYVTVPRTGGGGGGDGLWTTGNNNILKPKSTDYKILIGEIGILGPNILISNSGSRNEENINGACTPNIHYGSQTIEYSQGLVIGKRGLTCSDGKSLVINGYGLGIGSLPATETYALRVAGGSEMNVLKVNDSATINLNYFQNNKVGIQRIPGSSGEPLQISGGIQISNFSSPNVNGNCTSYGAIEYYNGKFFECVNGKWKINGGVEASNYSNPSKGNSCSPSGAIEYYNNKFFGCVNGVRGEFTVNTNTSQGMGSI